MRRLFRILLIVIYLDALWIAWVVPETKAWFWTILIATPVAWFGLLTLIELSKLRLSTLGSARFASLAELRALARSNGDLLIGRWRKKLLRYDGPSHLVTIAPTRSGKGVGTIIPNLLTANRSIICIDPKGENARVTMARRATFGAVHCLDPFGVSGAVSARFNPLDRLAPDSLDLADDAMTLADALVFDENDVEPHWNEEAKALLSGIMLYIVCHDDAQDRSLSTLRQYLTLAPEDFAHLIKLMQGSDRAGGLIARAANRFAGKADREAAGVLSSAQRHTHFLDSPRIANVVSASDFSFGDLKAEVATIFLILPPDRIDTYARWLRLLIAQAISELARSDTQTERPVLLLLDEFAALGRLRPVERAMALMAGYGVQLWPILQDIHQLRSLYGKSAGTFLSNAGVIQAFGVNDYETADMLSKTIGRQTVSYETHGSSGRDTLIADPQTTFSTAQHIATRNLLDPDEIMTLPPQSMLLLCAGARPLIVRKLRYFADNEFRGKFSEAVQIASTSAKVSAINPATPKHLDRAEG